MTTPAPGPKPACSPGWTGTPSPPTSTRWPGSTRTAPRTTSPSTGWKAISRSDTGAVLSVNRDTYTVIDHGEMGEIVEAVLAQPNVKWETAGVLDGGRSVWCLALLDEPVELAGDDSPTLPYLAITNRHDGTAACALRATAVRIVCANTFRAAELEGERTGATFSFIHKSCWRTRIEEARQRGHRRPHRDPPLHRTGRPSCWRIPVTPRQRELFVTEFIPMPPARSGHRPGGPQRRGSPPGASADLRVEDHRAGRGHRLRPGAGRGRVPRPRPHRPVLGDPAQPDPDPARAAQAPGPVADPRSRHRRHDHPRGAPGNRKPGHPAPSYPTEGEPDHEPDQHLLVVPALRRRVHLHPARARAVRPVPQPTWKRSPGWRRIANQPCPLCGGPVCADCGKALITLVPIPPAGLGQARRGGDRR